MSMWRGPTGVILALAVLAAAGGLYVQHRQVRAASADIDTSVIGQPAPDAALVQLDGRPTSLAKLRGKPVLVNFWATWCLPCRTEMPDIAAAARTYAAHGVQVIGIAEDSEEAVKAFAHVADPGYPLVIGSQAPATSTRFGNTHDLLPFSVLLDGQGKIVDAHLGKLDASTLHDWLTRN